MFADFGQYARVLEVSRRLDDGCGTFCRVAAFKNARANEHTIDAKLHHQRCIRGGGKAARRKVHHR